LGLNHSIEDIEPTEQLDWAQLCRLKIQFYRKKVQELGRPVLWIDADTELLARPEALRNSAADFGGMLRTGYINAFDPYKSTRLWSPALLYFGNTQKSRRFLDHMCDLDAKTPGAITDDYVFQEAWSAFEEELSIVLIPGSASAKRIELATEDSWIVHGDSGNVSEYKDKVLQHQTLKNRGALLTEAARDAMRIGDFATAQALLEASGIYGFDSIQKARRLSEVHRKQGRTDEAFRVIKNYSLTHPEDVQGKITYSKHLVSQGKLTSAERLLKEVESSDDSAAAAHATSLLFDLRQERKAKNLRVAPADRIRVWWMKQPYPGNLGDILNPYILEKLTGIPPRFASRGSGMLAIGSVIKFAKDGCNVWGTGTPRLTDGLNPNAVYHAVRGPLTRQVILESGGSCPEIYGDPALLMPLLYKPNVSKKYRLGIIRHVRQRSLGNLAPEVRDLNLLRVGFDEIESFIRELMECEMVITTSLHGLILAHAYGIPARWAEFSKTSLRIQGDGTKYLDYLRSVGLPDQVPLDLSQFAVLDDSLRAYVDPNCEISFNAKALLAAFPGKLKQEFNAYIES